MVLPVIYTFTGDDYTIAFFKKVKTRPTQLIQKSKKFLDIFTSLEDFPLNTSVLDVFEEFACHSYGHLKQSDVYEVINLHFKEKF